MNGEIILPITGFEGRYSITDHGRVYSHTRNIWMKTAKDRDGYEHLSLRKDGKSKNYRVHRLVGMAFVDGYLPDLTIDHIDGNKINNHRYNLRWCTRLENLEYSGKGRLHIKLCSPEGVIVEHLGLESFCRKYGLNNGCIHHLINGIYKYHKGWTRTF